MASRLVKLLKVTGIMKDTVLLTGGLALDAGLLLRCRRNWSTRKLPG